LTEFANTIGSLNETFSFSGLTNLCGTAFVSGSAAVGKVCHTNFVFDTFAPACPLDVQSNVGFEAGLLGVPPVAGDLPPVIVDPRRTPSVRPLPAPVGQPPAPPPPPPPPGRQQPNRPRPVNSSTFTPESLIQADSTP
jgi:hypothetical protein